MTEIFTTTKAFFLYLPILNDEGHDKPPTYILYK